MYMVRINPLVLKLVDIDIRCHIKAPKSQKIAVGPQDPLPPKNTYIILEHSLITVSDKITPLCTDHSAVTSSGVGEMSALLIL